MEIFGNLKKKLPTLSTAASVSSSANMELPMFHSGVALLMSYKCVILHLSRDQFSNDAYSTIILFASSQSIIAMSQTFV